MPRQHPYHCRDWQVILPRVKGKLQTRERESFPSHPSSVISKFWRTGACYRVRKGGERERRESEIMAPVPAISASTAPWRPTNSGLRSVPSTASTFLHAFHVSKPSPPIIHRQAIWRTIRKYSTPQASVQEKSQEENDKPLSDGADNNGTGWGKVSAVLFDMDGVLCNSEDLSRRAAVDLFAEFGVPVTGEDFVPFMGTGAWINAKFLLRSRL